MNINLSALLLLSMLAFIQNMTFTWASRSRNSGSPKHHRYAAWGSNGVWLLTNLTALSMILDPLKAGDFLQALPYMIVYTISTTEGSVFMMKILLGTVNVPVLSRLLVEKDNRKVGADGKAGR